MLKFSTINKKRKGERGKPCHKPLNALKKLVGDPLIRTAKEANKIHPIIHSIVYKFIPI
jgi:hypothetical protein